MNVFFFFNEAKSVKTKCGTYLNKYTFKCICEPWSTKAVLSRWGNIYNNSQKYQSPNYRFLFYAKNHYDIKIMFHEDV